MEDLMLIRSSFMRRIISSAINKAIAKQKYGIKVNLDDIGPNGLIRSRR